MGRAPASHGPPGAVRGGERLGADPRGGDELPGAPAAGPREWRLGASDRDRLGFYILILYIDCIYII